MRILDLEYYPYHLQQWILIAANFFVLFCAQACWADVYMQEQCGQTVRSHGERIYSQIGLHYQPNVNCTVTLAGRYKGQKILLQIEDIDIKGNADCYGDYLEIYAGSSKPYLMCEEGRRIATKVTSRKDSLRLVFVTDGKTNGRGFRAVSTALFSDKRCREYGKFRCANRRCISSLLTCDSVDHCGDGSDEKPSACTEKDYRNTAGKVGDTDVLIPELIFICIGASLVFFFFYFCIPQFVTHILYIHKKWVKKKDDEVESIAAGSNRPSITSLRPRPSDAFIPNWEVKMSELWDTSSNTISILRNASSRGNDDRDRAIADSVSAGKKVHIGRFMVQKSIIEEAVDEYDEDEDDYYQEKPVMRRKKIKTGDEDVSDDDDKRLSWIERREKRINRNLEKARRSENETDSNSSEGVPDNDTIRCEEKEALLKEVASSRAKSKTSSHNKPLPYLWITDRATSSQDVIRPRASTLPFLPLSESATFVPEWDFSDSEKSASIEESFDVPFAQKPQSAVQNTPNQKNDIGRFTTQKVETLEMESKLPLSPMSSQTQRSELDRQTSTDKTPTVNSNSNRNQVPPATNARVGRFTVQKVGTNTNENVQKMLSNAVQTPNKGRFTVEKVETNQDEVRQQDNATQVPRGQISTKGRFTIQKVGTDKIYEEPTTTNKMGRFSVTTSEQPDMDVISKEPSKTKHSRIKMPTGRFSVQKVPEEQRRHLVNDDVVADNHTSGIDFVKPITPKSLGTGRFKVRMIPEQRDNPKEAFKTEDTVTDETTPFLKDRVNKHLSFSPSYSDDEFSGVLETEI